MVRDAPIYVKRQSHKSSRSIPPRIHQNAVVMNKLKDNKRVGQIRPESLKKLKRLGERREAGELSLFPDIAFQEPAALDHFKIGYRKILQAIEDKEKEALKSRIQATGCCRLMDYQNTLEKTGPKSSRRRWPEKKITTHKNKKR